MEGDWQGTRATPTGVSGHLRCRECVVPGGVGVPGGWGVVRTMMLSRMVGAPSPRSSLSARPAVGARQPCKRNALALA
jgi:hypothetical protein